MSVTRPRAKRSHSPFRPTKRALAFHSPPSAVSLVPPRLSPAHSSASLTDRALTFLQSARDRNVPVRFGKWSREEDTYLEQLLGLFQRGLLAEIEPKTSLRSWLAQMLNCCPMRISKKQMHGHHFEGKAKYKRNASTIERLTQDQYQDLCTELGQRRAAFLKAWAKDEYGRRSAKMRTRDTQFTDWYDRVRRLVPTPKIAKPSGLIEYTTKRQLESLDDLRREMHEETKRQKGDMLVQMRAAHPAQDGREREGVEHSELALPLEPVPIACSSMLMSSPSIQTLPTTMYCSERDNLGDWFIDFDERVGAAPWTDGQGENQQTSQVPYTFCDDEVHVSVHLQEQHKSFMELTRSHTAGKLVLDAGAPSCWHSDEGTDQMPFGDWTDNDLTEEFAMSLEPGIFGWGESSPMAHMTCSPPLNFL